MQLLIGRANLFNQSESVLLSYVHNLGENQSVENPGVAFVKGTSERNEFFEKINKQ